MMIVPLLAGWLAKRITPGAISGVGFLLSAAGSTLLMRVVPDTGVEPTVLPMFMIGIGNGSACGLIYALAISVVPADRAGKTAGIFGTMRVAGEAVAIAVVQAALLLRGYGDRPAGRCRRARGGPS